MERRWTTKPGRDSGRSVKTRSTAAAAAVAARAAEALVPGRMPALYLGHGAPPLLDDALWMAELAAWAKALPRPSAVLMVSAHWTQLPLTLGATEAGVPLVYDFYGFPERYYRGDVPGAPGARARGARRGARRGRAGGSARARPRPRPRRLRAAGRHVPGGRRARAAGLAAEPRPGRTAGARRPPAAAPRRGRAHRRQRLHDPRPAVPQQLPSGRAAAGLVDGLRPVGGGGPRGP